MREVAEMRERWRQRSARKDEKFLERHLIPVVLGPKQHLYVIDHHHLCIALHEEKVQEVLITVTKDLSRLPREAFLVVLDNLGWMHPFDERGKRRPYADIPKSISDLRDDPFRSLAGALRRAGGFAKDTTPFSEFLWADYLRREIALKQVRKDFEGALKAALALAEKTDAAYLPGWCGTTE